MNSNNNCSLNNNPLNLLLFPSFGRVNLQRIQLFRPILPTLPASLTVFISFGYFYSYITVLIHVSKQNTLNCNETLNIILKTFSVPLLHHSRNLLLQSI